MNEDQERNIELTLQNIRPILFARGVDRAIATGRLDLGDFYAGAFTVLQALFPEEDPAKLTSKVNPALVIELMTGRLYDEYKAELRKRGERARLR